MVDVQKYDLVFNNKTLKFGIFVNTFDVPTFIGPTKLATVYSIPDSVMNIDDFNEFVDSVKNLPMSKCIYFGYWDASKIVKAKEYSKKTGLLLKVKHSG
jgi:hypothetical protein